MPMARAPTPSFRNANPGLPAARGCPGARAIPVSARNETRALNNRRMELSSKGSSDHGYFRELDFHALVRLDLQAANIHSARVRRMAPRHRVLGRPEQVAGACGWLGYKIPGRIEDLEPHRPGISEQAVMDVRGPRARWVRGPRTSITACSEMPGRCGSRSSIRPGILYPSH